MSHSHSFNVKWEDNTVEGGAGTAIRVKNVDNLTGAGGGFEGNASLPLSANTALSGAFDAVNAHNNLQPYITCYMWKRTA
jgi:hypothetical protein